MTEYSKFNIVYLLQRWMDSVPGQTFLNYAYSWGASIVILGTLFKLTHLPGANFMLFLGMGTEVFVFFLSAFDRPFDKTAIGMDLPTHLDEDESKEETLSDSFSPEEAASRPTGAPAQAGGTVIIGAVPGMAGVGAQPVAQPAAAQNGGMAASAESGQADEAAAASAQPAAGEFSEGQSATAGAAVAPGAQAAFVQPGAWIADQQQMGPELAEAQSHYVEELNNLTEMLQKVAEQSTRLTRDSEEMENLNRTLTGICKVYEMQLKGASQQIGTIDQINDQSRRMAQQIEQLNNIYARMIEAMTVNMRAAAPGGGTTPVQ